MSYTDAHEGPQAGEIRELKDRIEAPEMHVTALLMTVEQWRPFLQAPAKANPHMPQAKQ